MADKIHIKILTHEKTVYENDIDEFYIKAKDGQLGILKNHIPVVCSLDIGVLKTINNGEEECISVIGGILQFSNNRATILTDTAERECDIDVTRARHAKERAQARLKTQNEEIDIVRAQLSLARAIARISAKNKRL